MKEEIAKLKTRLLKEKHKLTYKSKQNNDK